ncbi:MAG: TetR/AcrR family transcriptional regulator [Lachnospiraceae bacterium]
MDKMKKMPTKERILYAALNLFSEKGYDGVGVDLIAEHAGMKGPSLYRHYKGKEDIFNSLIDRVEAYYKERIRSGNQDGKTPETMEELINRSMVSIEFTMHDEIIQKIRKVMAMEQFRNDRISKLTSRYHLENMQEMYTGIFKDLMKKGVLKPDDPEALSLEFVAPVSLLIHMYDRQPEREEEIMEKIKKHFTHFADVYGKEQQL